MKEWKIKEVFVIIETLMLMHLRKMDKRKNTQYAQNTPKYMKYSKCSTRNNI